jgi:pimeloyl-ACP methyl ester carboxylesterase
MAENRMSNLPADLRFSRRSGNGAMLDCAEAGPEDGHLVFLLHGFPEFWFGWREQIGPLAAAGFRVIAPDQRGYNKSDKPKGTAPYDLDCLAADVVALASALGRTQFSLVGHDWGGSVGWWASSLYPDRVKRLAVLNAPHPAIWKNAMQNNPEQKRLSAYVRLIGMPPLVELALRFTDNKGLVVALRQSKRPPSEEDLAQYRAAWSQPGAMTAMLNWYRALLAKPLPIREQRRISAPTCLIWGRQDAYCVPELAEESIALCNHGTVVWMNDATHWVQHDEPERVNRMLIEFLT